MIPEDVLICPSLILKKVNPRPADDLNQPTVFILHQRDGRANRTKECQAFDSSAVWVTDQALPYGYAWIQGNLSKLPRFLA
jgi:hypothetical protein